VGLYADYILPHLINCSMRNRDLQPYRERVISQAEGRVLEIGIGSGLNLAFYGPGAVEILGLDPSRRLLSMAGQMSTHPSGRVKLIRGSAEAIPLENDSIDTVVTTWTLCTVPDALGALSEIRRVLRPRGHLLFVEHGLALEDKIRAWQNRITPLWKRFAGGCHLNRPIRDLIEKAGFTITQIHTGYSTGPRPMTFFYQGRANRS